MILQSTKIFLPAVAEALVLGRFVELLTDFCDTDAERKRIAIGLSLIGLITREEATLLISALQLEAA